MFVLLLSGRRPLRVTTTVWVVVVELGGAGGPGGGRQAWNRWSPAFHHFPRRLDGQLVRRHLLHRRPGTCPGPGVRPCASMFHLRIHPGGAEPVDPVSVDAIDRHRQCNFVLENRLCFCFMVTPFSLKRGFI